MSHAMELLNAQLSAGKSKQQIGDEIGYSRTAVSLYASGKYGGDLSKIEAAIVRAFDRRDCPHSSELVDADVCRIKALAPRPFGGNARLAWWKTCQTCPHHPGEKA